MVTFFNACSQGSGLPEDKKESIAFDFWAQIVGLKVELGHDQVFISKGHMNPAFCDIFESSLSCKWPDCQWEKLLDLLLLAMIFVIMLA